MEEEPVSTQQPESVEGLVRTTVDRYRSKLLDLSSRNPLVNFRHSERSRSHIRVVNEIPEILFAKLEAGRELTFEPVPDPILIPDEELAPDFEAALRKAKRTDEEYQGGLTKLGPNPSERQRRKLERQLRDRLRLELGLQPFTPTLDPQARAREVGINPAFDLPRNNGQTDRHFRDLDIQTLFFREDLDRKLSALRDSARVLLNDAGLNALYCAFGFLEYYVSAATDERRIAPLVFYPVELDRVLQDGEYRYFIRPTNGEIEINVALAELLRQELALELPQWKEAENDSSALELFFSNLENVISKRPEWRLRRYVTVGLFTFSTLVMYKDIELQKWTTIGAPLEKHDLLRTLVAGAEVRASRFAEDYAIDEVKDRDVLLVTDADSSQHSAVIDVLTGKNCVIQGPPGTGKSQTITNIIAAALYAGKSVLFVAEKMAALEVVAKRLRAASVGQFCLELHSTKTNKAALLGSLSSRLDYQSPRPPSQRIQSNLEALERAKKELIYYVQKTNESAGQTGLTVHEVLVGSAKRETARNQLPITLSAARLASALNITQHQRAEMLAAAATVEVQLAPLAAHGCLKEHPWRGFQNIEITDFETDEMLSRLRVWTNAMESIALSIDAIGETSVTSFPQDVNSLQKVCDAVVSLSLPGISVIPSVLSRLNRVDARKIIDEIVETVQMVVSAESDLRQYTANPASVVSVGSTRLASVVHGLDETDIRCCTVGTLKEVLSRTQETRRKLGKAQQAAEALLRAFNLSSENIESIRAVTVGAELLRELEREAWSSRTKAVLGEPSATALKAAETRCRNLIGRRETLEAKFDLASLPGGVELPRYAFAIKTTSAFLAPFNRDCREGKKVYRFAARHPERRVSRLEIADDLRQCAQYLTDEKQFLTDQSIRSLCGQDFNGLRTPFKKLIGLNTWAARLTSSLSLYGQVGEKVRNVLFTGTIDELEAVAAQTTTENYAALKSIVDTYAEGHVVSLQVLQEREAIREARLNEAIATLTEAEILSGTELESLRLASALTRRIEEKSAEIERDPRVRSLLAGSIAEMKAALGDLKATSSYAKVLAQLPVPTSLIDWFFASVENVKSGREKFMALAAKIEQNKQAVTRFDEFANLDPTLWCGKGDLDDSPLATLIERCKRAAAVPLALRDYVSFLLAEDAACDAGLGPVLKAYLEAEADYRDLEQAADLVFYRSASEQILNDDPRLKRHTGATHDQLRRQYQQLDREFLKLRQTLLCAQLAERPIPEGNYLGKVGDLTELALIQHLAGQARPRIAIRELFRRASKAIQALMPCWMMSPMSVAQFLQPGAVVFDLVVMDEASQIRPEEALGAIVRGKQLTVVGDQMQLPPTPFFQKLSLDGGAEDDDEEALDVKQESVLEAAAARFYPVRRLKWHYRSEHGSLISFSNREFYEGDLTVFPSPHHDHPHYGVKLVEVGGRYNAGTNESEVNAIVEGALDFMAHHSDQSLGLVAVNSKQADLIRERMDKAFAENPQAEAYRARWESELESFFVKNLENVQGDERDAIFISTVYGPDQNGNFYQRFGPINSEYGHRRLNVLFTRAKKKVILFTSMKPEDIQDEGKNWGVRALKGYIQFARDGDATLPEPGSDECDSEFERWVMDSLRVAGFEAVPQLGFAGYRIDIAVKHPRHPGIFLCGIECDGAAYHSARSVRERDRLRQEILERLGWRIYRIWSTDWFRNSGLEMSKLLDYLRKLASGTEC